MTLTAKSLLRLQILHGKKPDCEIALDSSSPPEQRRAHVRDACNREPQRRGLSAATADEAAAGRAADQAWLCRFVM